VRAWSRRVRHHLPPPGRHPLLRVLDTPLAASLVLALFLPRIGSVMNYDLRGGGSEGGREYKRMRRDELRRRRSRRREEEDES